MAGDDNDNDNSEDDAPANTVELHPKRTTSFAARRKKKKNQPAVLVCSALLPGSVTTSAEAERSWDPCCGFTCDRAAP